MLDWLALSAEDVKIIGSALGAVILSFFAAVLAWVRAGRKKEGGIPTSVQMLPDIATALREMAMRLTVIEDGHERHETKLDHIHELSNRIHTDTQVLRERRCRNEDR